MLHATPAVAAQNFQLTALSSRPDMVSGGDVLIRIDVPQDTPLDRAILKLNGQDVTSLLRPDVAEHTLIGLVSGLKLGPNSLEVFDGNSPASRVSQLTLTNYTITGPIFSGPQEEPFYCQTQDFRLPDGSSLGAPIDSKCTVKTVISYVYKSSALPASADPKVAAAAAIKPLTSMSSFPPDMAWTTTSLGKKVPYIVRIETGTINRAIYQIAVLHDPTQESQPEPTAPPKAWNKRLLYSFGGGCPGGWLKQGSTLGWGNALGYGSVVNDAVVGKGYAEASATLDVFGNNCNSVISAETMMMVKERFIKLYGKPLFTMSVGGSGGAEQQIPIADGYPGLLDGIIPSATFPDVLANAQNIIDSQLLDHYFSTIGDALTLDQKTGIMGAARVMDFTSDANRIKSAVLCPKELPPSQRYDPKTNPKGVRCDVFDHTVDVFGRDPETGFARRPVDNTGVQYGLAALNSGKITKAQFLDLNQNIGGYDDDGNIVSARSVADRLALRAAYQSDLVVNGSLGLGNLPIIDVRAYLDMLPQGNVHLKYHSFSLRERLLKANGEFANEVLLVSSNQNPAHVDQYAMVKMDEWLTNLARDTSKDPIVTKIMRAKPTDLVDSCYTESGERIAEQQVATGGRCNELYPTFQSPRMIAGGPVTNDNLKCQLKPIDYKDYTVMFTDSEKSRLSMIFPGGVCDWSKLGVEQQRPSKTWVSY